MTPITTRSTHGHYTVVGWLILVSVHGEDSAKQRVTELWVHGSTLTRVSVGYWLTLPRPQSARGPFPALPVLQTPNGPSALATPPTSSDGTGLHLPTPDGPQRERGRPESPSTWLSLDFAPVTVTSLATPTPPRVFEERVATRADLGVDALDDAGKNARAVLAALTSQRDGTANVSPSTPNTIARPPGWTRTLMRAVLTPLGLVGGVTKQVVEGVLPIDIDRFRPQWMDRLGRWLDGWMAPLLSKQHEEYLKSLSDLFNTDDIDAALRRAIPLGEGGTGARLAKRLAPRDNILVPGQRYGRSGGGLAGTYGTYIHLRKQYEKAALWLESEGDITKAAFVWSDLLKRHLKAIRLCEKHALFDTAARLAEMHNHPARAVANWIRHGDDARAIALARRTQTYSAAIALLQESDPESLAVLRKSWAQQLYDGGSPLRAVEVMEPDAQLYATSKPWIDELVDSDGPTSQVGRIHRLALTGELGDAEALVAWMADASPVQRALLLRECPRLDQTSVIANQTYRALVRQTLPFVDGLALTLDARCLQDVRQSTVLQPIPNAAETHEFPVGNVDVVRAELLMGGMVVLTTHDSVRLMDLTGRELCRHYSRAWDIIPSTTNGSVLLIEEVSDATQPAFAHYVVYRLNTLTGTLIEWTTVKDVVEETTYNDVHDGLWWVAKTDRIVALDVTSEDATELVTLRGIHTKELIAVCESGTVVQARDLGGDTFEWRGPSWQLSRRYPEWDAPDPSMRAVHDIANQHIIPAAFDNAWCLHTQFGRIDILHNQKLHASFPVWK